MGKLKTVGKMMTGVTGNMTRQGKGNGKGKGKMNGEKKGKMEEDARQRRRKGEIEDAVLASLVIAGTISMALIAPNALSQLSYLPHRNARFAAQAKTAAGRLVRKGYAEWVARNGTSCLRLTEKGEAAIQFEKEKMRLTAKQKRKWDERWRMVIFDVPESRKAVRNKLSLMMREVGFVRLQDSVWVYPYDCEDFVALLKADLKIGKDVLYAIAETIENDASIRRYFSLPLLP